MVNIVHKLLANVIGDRLGPIPTFEQGSEGMHRDRLFAGRAEELLARMRKAECLYHSLACVHAEHLASLRKVPGDYLAVISARENLDDTVLALCKYRYVVGMALEAA